MMPVFMSPAAFWGTATLLILLAVYFFRRQARDVKVSSLMFYSKARVPAQGGRRLTTLQTPFILLVELLILALLVLAAADPKAISGEKLVPAVIVLDDSFSMKVDHPASPRARALKYLESAFFSRSFYRITLVRAGSKPEIIGRHDMTGNEARQLIDNWRCASAIADLQSAVRHVSESFAPDTNVFVITDFAAEHSYSENLNWLAFGQPVANLAVTAASRYSLGNSDRCFFEFTSFASQSARLEAEIFVPTTGQILESIVTDLPARATRRVRINVDDTAAPVCARIRNDAVDFDNQAWLMPVRRQPVEVELDIASSYLKKIVQHSVDSSGLAVVTEKSAQILITDQPGQRNGGGLWQYVIAGASQPVLLRGQVAVDKEHPLCVGLPPVRAAWAVDQLASATGVTLMSAGDISLLSVSGSPEQNLTITLNLTAEYSNLQLTPIWPVLFWNLLNWRQQTSPGPDSFNYRSGAEINVTLPVTADSVQMHNSSGKTVDGVVWHKKAVFRASDPGIYSLTAGNASWTVAVNLLSPEESDLQKSGSRAVPDESLDRGILQNFANVRWWFLVPALLLMALHQWLTSRRRTVNVY